MHPLGKVVEVLPVAVPLEPRIEGLVRTPLGEWLADAKTPAGRMLGARVAEPALARVVLAVLAEHLVDSLDELQGSLAVRLISGRPREAEAVADREGVGPEIAPAARRPLGELTHQCFGSLQALSTLGLGHGLLLSVARTGHRGGGRLLNFVPVARRAHRQRRDKHRREQRYCGRGSIRSERRHRVSHS